MHPPNFRETAYTHEILNRIDSLITTFETFFSVDFDTQTRGYLYKLGKCNSELIRSWNRDISSSRVG